MVNLQRLTFLVAVASIWLCTGTAHAQSCATTKPANIPALGTSVSGCGGATSDGKGVLTMHPSTNEATGLCYAGPACGAAGIQQSYSWTFTPEPKDTELEAWCSEYGGGKWNDLRTDPMPLAPVGTNQQRPKQTCARPGIMPPDFKPGKGCTFNFDAAWGASTEDGKYVWQGTGTGVGTGCKMTPEGQSGDGDKPDASTPDCPDGTLVTYNGVQVCMPLDKEDPPSQVKESETKKEPDGSTSTTNKTTTGTTKCNPHNQTCTRVTETLVKKGNTGKPGIVDVEKVTKTTTCGPNGCTTTTTTTNGTETDTGTPTGTSTTNTATKEGESKEGFCKENPELQMCQDSAFSGSCSASFKCDGDAIQCSIAKEQHQRNCKFYDDKSPESELYDKHQGKEGDQTKDNPKNESVSMANRISSQDVFGSGGVGVKDLQITVLGNDVTLKFSDINPGLQMFGAVLVAVSLLAAVFIVFKG